MHKQKGVVEVVLVLAVVVLAVGGYFLYQNNSQIELYTKYDYPPLQKGAIVAQGSNKGNLLETHENKSSFDVVEERDSEWVEYENKYDGYSFMYPKSWYLLECSNGDYLGNVHLSSKSFEGKKCIAETREE